MNTCRHGKAKCIAGMVAISCFGVSSLFAATDIWGTGEVPRLSDPADVPQTLTWPPSAVPAGMIGFPDSNEERD